MNGQHREAPTLPLCRRNNQRADDDSVGHLDVEQSVRDRATLFPLKFPRSQHQEVDVRFGIVGAAGLRPVKHDALHRESVSEQPNSGLDRLSVGLLQFNVVQRFHSNYSFQC